MSSEYVARLRRRALNLLRIAEGIDDYDLVMFMADQAVQLYVKATYYELFGVRVRGHGIRELLGVLAKDLERQGFTDDSRLIRDFVVSNRDVLIMLEEAYTEGRYGEVAYDVDDVSKAISVAKELMAS